jgi:hypothetical protein
MLYFQGKADLLRQIQPEQKWRKEIKGRVTLEK